MGSPALTTFDLCPIHTKGAPLTNLRRVDGHHRAEGTLSFAVVSADLDVERRERRDALVAVHVARRARGGGGHVGPADLSKGAEGDDVTEAFAILQFFGDRLRVKHKTIVILKHIQTAHTLPRRQATAAAVVVELQEANCFSDPANKRSSEIAFKITLITGHLSSRGYLCRRH